MIRTDYGHTKPKIAPRSAISDVQSHLLDLGTWRNLMVDGDNCKPNLGRVIDYFDESARDLRI